MLGEKPNIDSEVDVSYNNDKGYFVPVMDFEGHICYILCSVCGSLIMFTPFIEEYRFCPLCGHPWDCIEYRGEDSENSSR